jgi:hypothetical protein
MGRSMVGALVGEVDGVFSKGVEVWLSSSKSKFERLEVGLVLVESGGIDVVGFGMSGDLFWKRPELSLSGPWSFV